MADHTQKPTLRHTSATPKQLWQNTSATPRHTHTPNPRKPLPSKGFRCGRNIPPHPATPTNAGTTVASVRNASYAAPPHPTFCHTNHHLILTQMPIRRPCLDCRQLTTERSRCPTCQGRRQALVDAYRAHKRNHYQGDYRARARAVREAATHCWICGEGPRPDDPWQADHVYPGQPDSPLAPAHRSCNIRRRFMTGG